MIMKEETCPKCVILMVEQPMWDITGIEVNHDRLIWKVEQGLLRYLVCPKCKNYSFQEGHFGNALNKSASPDGLLMPEGKERREKYHLGEIPRDLWMKAKGWLIEYLIEHRYNALYNMAKLTAYFDGKLCLQEEKIRERLSFDQQLADKVLSDIKNVSLGDCEGLPDFLFSNKKDTASIFFVECKALGSVLLANQKVVFERLENLGYQIKVLEMRLWLERIDYDRFVSLINWRDKL